MAAADPELALRLAKTVADIYGDAAATILTRLAERLAAGADDPTWRERKLAEVLAMQADAQTVVEALQATGLGAVETAIVAGASAGQRAAATEVGATATVTAGPAVQALARETVGAVAGTHLRILRWTSDIYRRVIAEASVPAVVTGAATRRDAAQAALNRFARAGVTGFTDTAGRSWELESYTEMATRTGTGRAMVEGRLQVYEADDRDLVIVSDAPEECAACRPWEGRVLSIRGRAPGYPTVADATRRGLFHPNCRHDLRPFVPGLTRRFPNPTADPHGDALRQRQRHLERRIRAAKRQVAADTPFASPRDPAARARLARSKAVLVQAQADMRAFVDEHDRKRLAAREQIGRAR